MSAPASINETVGANIKRLRTARGLTLAALAEKAGMDDSYLGKMERGVRGTTPENYDRLAKALGVSLSSIFRSEPGAPRRGAA